MKLFKNTLFLRIAGGLVVLAVIMVIAISTNTKTNTAKASENELYTINVPLPKNNFEVASQNFKIKFPESPATFSSSYKTSAGTILISEYRQQYQSGLEYGYYIVFVFDFPNDYQYSTTPLQTALDQYLAVINSSFPGASLTSNQSVSFKGYSAQKGLITVPARITKNSKKTSPTPDYFLLVIKNNKAYIISTYGIDQTEFNDFVNNFNFVG